MFSFDFSFLGFAAVKRFVVRLFDGTPSAPVSNSSPPVVKTFLSPTRTIREPPTKAQISGGSGSFDALVAFIVLFIGSTFLLTSLGSRKLRGGPSSKWYNDILIHFIHYVCLVMALALVDDAWAQVCRLYQASAGFARSLLGWMVAPAFNYGVFLGITLKDLGSSSGRNEVFVLITLFLLAVAVIWVTVCHAKRWVSDLKMAVALILLELGLCTRGSAGTTGYTPASQVMLAKLHSGHANTRIFGTPTSVVEEGEFDFEDGQIDIDDIDGTTSQSSDSDLNYGSLDEHTPAPSVFSGFDSRSISAVSITPSASEVSNNASDAASKDGDESDDEPDILRDLAKMRAEDPKNELLRPPPVPRDPWDLDYDEEASLEEVEAIISAPAAPTVNVEPSSESIEVDVPSPSSPLDTIAEADEDEGLTEGDMSVEVEDYSKRPTLPLVCALFPHGVLISGRETLVYDTPSGCARLPTLGPDYKPIEGSGRLDTPPRHLWEKIARAAEAAFHRDHAKFGMWNWRDYAKELEAEDALPNHGSLQALHDTFNSKGWDRLSGEYFQEGADLGYSDSLDDLLRAEDGVDL